MYNIKDTISDNILISSMKPESKSISAIRDAMEEASRALSSRYNENVNVESAK